jgi:hypothetical protein
MFKVCSMISTGLVSNQLREVFMYACKDVLEIEK